MIARLNSKIEQTKTAVDPNRPQIDYYTNKHEADRLLDRALIEIYSLDDR